MKASKKLYSCAYCRRPMMTLKPPPKREDGTRDMKGGWIWVTGPSTHPKIKRWCDGSCDGLTLHLDAFRSDVEELVKKNKRRLKWIRLSFDRFTGELEEYLKARDQDRVPRSEKTRKAQEELRKMRKAKTAKRT